MAGQIHSTAEVGAMTRQLADRYGERVGEILADRISDKLAAKASAFEPTGDDQRDARAVMASLADVFDDMDLAEIEQVLGEALFQAGAVGLAATPLTAET